MSELGSLAENGVLGILLVTAISAVAFLYREVRSLQDKRIQDLKESRDAVITPLSNLEKTAERTLTIVENLKNNG